MIDRIIDFSVRNKFIVFALVAVGCIAGWWSMKHMTLDAIPDLGDTQVIIFSRWDRSPDIIEDQVTYPIVSTLVGAPKVKAVRGFSDFGYSYVYVIFEDGTDIYWARSRTQEYLSSVLPRLPDGVKSEIGPDATPLGWVFQYALVDESGKHSLAELRSYQDFYLKYYLREVPGVAEVAPVGGFGKQYQVNVDPNRLQAYGLSINRVVEAVRGRQLRVGGPSHRVRRDRVQHPGPGIHQVRQGPGEHRRLGQRLGHAHPPQGHRAGDGGTRPAQGRCRSRRQGGRGLGHRHHAARAECPGRDRAGQGEAPRDRTGAPSRREGRPRLRPLGPDPALDRQPENHGHRGAHHRVPGGLALSLARPERPHPADHHPRGHSPLLHPLPDDGDHGQHHVPVRDRHRHRGHGGRLDRGRRADPQEPGAMGEGRPAGGLSIGGDPGREAGGRSQLLCPAGDRRLPFSPSSPWRPRKGASSSPWPTRRTWP